MAAAARNFRLIGSGIFTELAAIFLSRRCNAQASWVSTLLGLLLRHDHSPLNFQGKLAIVESKTPIKTPHLGCGLVPTGSPGQLLSVRYRLRFQRMASQIRTFFGYRRHDTSPKQSAVASD